MEELTMSVSGICRKDGKKLAYVTFSDAERKAEGVIPDCKILSQTGFTEEEAGQLELYMKMNLAELKKQAAAISPLRAMMKQAGLSEAQTASACNEVEGRINEKDTYHKR